MTEPVQATPPQPTQSQDFAEKLLSAERARAAAEEQAREVKRASDERMRSLESKLEEVLQRTSPKTIDPANPLGSVEEDKLHSVLHDPDQDAQSKRIAMDEILRRGKEKMKSELRREQEARFEQERVMQDALAEVQRDYGKEYLEDGTPERQAAQKHMQALQRRYGDGVMYDPKAQILAASMAFAEAAKTRAEKAREVERERDELKRRNGVQGGQQNVYRPEEPAKELLKKGDVKGALRSMKLWTRLNGGNPEG